MPRRRPLRPCSPTPSLDSSPDSIDTSSPKHPARNAANARERARMRVLSRAFCRLKTTLPWVPADTKLSKLDTLRLATSYIAHLRAVLTDGVESTGQKHPLSLTWPFSFQQSSTTLSSNYDSVGCWTNSRDSEDEDYPNSSMDTSNQNIPIGHNNSQEIIKDYAPYYQQYTDSLMHIG